MSRGARREYETDEYLAMLERMIRRAGERVAEADEPELARLNRMIGLVRDAVEVGARGQYARQGTWTWVGRALGISRQTAHERFAPREKASA